MYFHVVERETSWPSKASSARILGTPLVGFSRDIRRIRLRISFSVLAQKEKLAHGFSLVIVPVLVMIGPIVWTPEIT